MGKVWQIGGFIDHINALSVGFVFGPTPRSSKRKLCELLRNRGYDEDFIASINDDVVNGYSVVRQNVGDMYSPLWTNAFKLRDGAAVTGFDKEKLEWSLEKDAISKLMCEMMMQNISSFSNTAKAQRTLMKILKEWEYEIDEINENFTIGYNLGMEIFMDAVSRYYASMECWDENLQ